MVQNRKKTSEIGLTPFTPAAPSPRLDENRVIGCEYLHYPWDDWEHWAIAQGLDARLAAFGRLTVREAYQHQWDDVLKRLCGWQDDGQAMLAYALRFPQAARRQWDILLRTDGLRGDYKPRTTEWVWGFLKSDARRLLARIQRKTL
jgi:hypothetical protein